MGSKPGSHSDSNAGEILRKQSDHPISNYEELSFQTLVYLEKRTTQKRYQIRQLFVKFRKLSGDSHAISREIFMNAFVDGTYLATRDIIAEATFKMFDRDNKGSIEFVDFAITLSKCSSGDKRNRLKFIFDMFDSNKDSFMSRDEFIAFIDIICGPNQRSGSTFYEECSESPSICQTEMDLDHNTNNLHQNKSLASNVYDNSKLFDINGSSQNSHVPIFSRSASDSLPTYEESLKRSKFKLSARNLANFIGKEGQIPFDVFADWAMDHFEVSDILKRFDILPSIHDERNSIKQILSKFPELKLGESWCLLDCKWWEMQKEYVCYDDQSSSVPDDQIMDRNKSSLNEFSPDSNTENDNQYYSNQRPISIDNLSLQGDFEQILKIGIEENRDYVLIPSEAQRYFIDWYSGGPTFERHVISLSNGYLQIDLYPLFLSLWHMKDSNPCKVSQQTFDLFRISSQSTIKDLFSLACKKLDVDLETSHLQIGDGISQWRRIMQSETDSNLTGGSCPNESTSDDSHNPAEKQISDLPTSDSSSLKQNIKTSSGSSTLSTISDESKNDKQCLMQVECDDVLSDLGFSLKTNVLIEVVNDEGIYEMEYKQNNKNFWKFFSIGSELDIKYPNNKWILSTVRKVKKDEYGKIIKILVNCDGQGPNCDNQINVSFCDCPSQECHCSCRIACPRTHSQRSLNFKKWPFRSIFYSSQGRVENQGTSEGIPGATGLFNLGNTCFMNSSLQCLSNAPILSQHFDKKQYEQDINKTNPLGTGGKLADQYAKLHEQLQSGKFSSVAPNSFKRALTQIAPQFSGYQQHDSHELLAYILDGLHEDLNRIKNKPVTEKIEMEGRPDKEVAELTQNTHLKRNDSIIVEVFQAQLRSEVICPKPSCNHISITFDPFMYLSVPLPSVNEIQISFLFVPLEKPPVQYSFILHKHGSYGDLKVELSSRVGIETWRLLVGLVQKNKVFTTYTDIKKINSFRSIDEILVYEQDSSLLPKRGIFANEHCYSQITHEFPEEHEPKSCSNRFGIPYLITYSSKTLSKIMKKFIWRTISTFLPKNISKEKQPYKILMLNKYHRSCGFCQSLRCPGCELTEELGENLPLGILFVVVWESDVADIVRKNMEDMIIIDKSASLVKQTPQSTAQPPNLSVNLYDCLRMFTKKEILSKNDAWYCSKCKEFRCASKKIDIWSCPEILIIQIKRFHVYRGFREKISTMVDFPISGLDLRKFAVAKDENVPIYDLFAVSNHSGGLGGGHYTSFAKNLRNGRWFYYDDSSCTPIEISRIVTSHAYILFYRRRH